MLIYVFLQFGGVKEGDFIVAIGERDVKWASHDEVVALIKNAGDSLCLKLVTPMDRNYLKVRDISNRILLNLIIELCLADLWSSLKYIWQCRMSQYTPNTGY